MIELVITLIVTMLMINWLVELIMQNKYLIAGEEMKRLSFKEWYELNIRIGTDFGQRTMCLEGWNHQEQEIKKLEGEIERLNKLLAIRGSDE